MLPITKFMSRLKSFCSPSDFQSMFRTNRGTVGGYFPAGRTMTWWPVSSAISVCFDFQMIEVG